VILVIFVLVVVVFIKMKLHLKLYVAIADGLIVRKKFFSSIIGMENDICGGEQ
jgi:hypothetical protein